MRKQSIQVVTFVGLLIALWSPSWLSAQATPPRPEYFGFYALDGGKLIAIGDGTSDTPATIQQVIMSELRGSKVSQRSRPAVQVGGNVHFLLFDVSPAEAARAISMYRLPFIKNTITVSDVPSFNSGGYDAQKKSVNLPAMIRLSESQIRLLQKPVPSLSQMIELVPVSQLTPGLYGVLFAPGIGKGGEGTGQSAGWTAVLLVGQAPEAAQAGQCIDLILTGGLGGMLNIDSPDTGRISSFPHIGPNHARPCAGTRQPGNGQSSPVGVYVFVGEESWRKIVIHSDGTYDSHYPNTVLHGRYQLDGQNLTFIEGRTIMKARFDGSAITFIGNGAIYKRQGEK